MAQNEIHLTADEARFLALDLLRAIDAVEDDEDLTEWAAEARLWVDLLLTRLRFGDGSH